MAAIQRAPSPRVQPPKNAARGAVPPVPARKPSVQNRAPIDTFSSARPTSLLSLSAPPPPPPPAPPAAARTAAPAASGAELTPEQAAKKAADTLANYRAQLLAGKKLEDLDIPEEDQNMAVFASVLEQGGTPEALWTSPELTQMYEKLKPEEQREVMSGAFSNQLRKNLLAQLKEQMDHAAQEVEKAMHGG